MATYATKFAQFRVVTAADVSDPVDTSVSIDPSQWDQILFGIDFTTTNGSPVLTVQPIWWDVDRSGWYTDSSQAVTYNTTGHKLLQVASHGMLCYLKVTALDTGPGAQATIRYSLQRMQR